MALIGKTKKIKENGQEKEIFSVQFTNGTFTELKELKEFLTKEGFTINELEDVIRMGIAWLEKVKSNKAREHKINDD